MQVSPVLLLTPVPVSQPCLSPTTIPASPLWILVRLSPVPVSRFPDPACPQRQSPLHPSGSSFACLLSRFPDPACPQRRSPLRPSGSSFACLLSRFPDPACPRRRSPLRPSGSSFACLLSTSNKAQASVTANRKETYNRLLHPMTVLNPDKWDHDNPRYGDEVRALCHVLHLNEQEAHIGFIEYKASGGRSIPNKIRKLLVAVDTLSASNADCERGFSTMNNIITEYRSKLTAKNAANLLFVSSVGPPCMQWGPNALCEDLAGQRKKSSSHNKWHGSPPLRGG